MSKIQFAVRHKQSGEIITYIKENTPFLEHNGNDLAIGFDGKIYRFDACGYPSIPCVDYEDMSHEYELIIIGVN